MLTSKEIIERTGISRATLNNYIASGLVARPQVLPPGPEHGDAPRIGYFPDDTLERIETIQRLKREGWSMVRIAEHFTGVQEPAIAAVAAARPQQPPAPVAAPPTSAARNLLPSGPALTPLESTQPAYLVNDGFRLVWMNEPARTWPLSPFAGQAPFGSVFQHLLQVEEAAGRDALLRFHLEAARSRAVPASELFAALPAAEGELLHVMYREIARPAALPLVAQTLLPRAAAAPQRWIHAVHFHEGVLFSLGDAAQQPAAAAAPARTAPMLTPVAVVVAVLQEAADLWVRLSAEEYFELLNEVAAEVEAALAQHQGVAARGAPDSLAGYFLPQARGSHLWNALAAAHQAREAMRQVSQRWRARKGWDLDLALSIGIDEGQEWLGTLGAGAQADLRVLGDAADRAAQLARSGRKGAILLTRNLVGKLSREERQRLSYGVPRLDAAHGDAPLLSTFARLADLAGAGPAPPAAADVAVAELLALQPALPDSPGSSR